MPTAFAHNPDLQQIQSIPLHHLPAVNAVAEGNGDQAKSHSVEETEDVSRRRGRPLSSEQLTETFDQIRHRSYDIVRDRRGNAEDGDDDEDDDEPNIAAMYALRIQGAVYGVFLGRGAAWRRFALVMAVCLFAVYFGYAEQRDFRGNVGLLVFTVIALLIFAYKCFGDVIQARLRVLWDAVCSKLTTSQRKYTRWASFVVVALVVVSLLAVEVSHDPIRLMSCLGVAVFILFAFLFSKTPSKVEWHVVFAGLLLQLVIAFLVLRWSTGNKAVRYAGDVVVQFLGYSDAGSAFVYGDFRAHEFAFQVLSTVFFFGALTSLLYYWKVLQVLICKLGGAIEFLIHATPVEAFVGAANIFLGANVSILTVAKLMDRMTVSELHCVMTSGFATVTGGLFGAYLSFGIPASHLIAASVMSAPAAILMSKLLYPETKRSVLRNLNMKTFESPTEHSSFHAFYMGAVLTLPIAASIAVNLISFVALLEFANGTLKWLGDRVAIQDLSFQLICSYVFAPLPFFMGVEPSDCRQVARLIGTKLFLTEIVAYHDLGVLMKNRRAGISPHMSPRSEIIATYALCGFASFLDIGICLGTVGAIVPSKKREVAHIALRSMIAGNIACFVTACIAGTVYHPDLPLPGTDVNSTTVANDYN